MPERPLVIAFTGMPASGKGEAVKVAQQAIAGHSLPVVRMGDLIWERCRELGLELTPENVGRVANEERERRGKEVWARATVRRIRELLDEGHTPVATLILDDVDPRGMADTQVRELPNEVGTKVANGGAPASSSNSSATTQDPTSPASKTARPPLPSLPAAIIDGLRSPAELAVFKEAFGERLRVIAITSSSSVRASRVGSRGRVDDATDPAGFQARDRRELDWGLDRVIQAADHTIANDGTLEDLQEKVGMLVRGLLHGP